MGATCTFKENGNVLSILKTTLDFPGRIIKNESFQDKLKTRRVHGKYRVTFLTISFI